MPIDAVSATSSTYDARATDAAAPKQTLDSEVFLQLLVAQLTNQDPSSPMDTNAMISQTTELATMEQLTALTENSSEAFALSMRQAAAALIGQQASYLGADGETATGLVTKVSFDGPVPQVTVGDQTVPLDAILGLAAPAAPTPVTPAPATTAPTTTIATH